MFPTFCGPMGVAGWLLMLLLWAGLVVLAVWGIARLFPDRAQPARPPLPPQRRPDEDDAFVDSGRP